MRDFNTLKSIVERITTEIASVNAEEVDRDARFPAESIDALKSEKLLSAGVPANLGGDGLDIQQLGQLCKILARGCSSSSMVLGMHYIKVSSIVHFRDQDPFFENYLRQLHQEQRLVGSVTSEEGIGGNLRNSIAAVQNDVDRFTLEKHSSCLSYGAYADDLLITCRRADDSAASDQVLLLATKEDLDLTQNGVWDSMGMRGTCSPPFIVKVNAMKCQIFKSSFAEIAARTMVPDTHIIWAHIWLGIATEAAHRARSLIQLKARKIPDSLPAGSSELAELEIRLDRFRDTVKSVTNSFLEAHNDDNSELLSSIPFSLKINGLKLNASQLVADICTRAMAICGFAGYLNNTPYSIARLLRDSLSAAPMIGNGRIIETNATHLMAYKGEGI